MNSRHFISTAVFLLLSSIAFAESAPKKAEITVMPTEERAFVNAVGQMTKAQVVALLGEPAKSDDVKLKDSGRVVASIWYYHNINTDDSGAYYPTTELDFIDDKVNMVAFLNNDGVEIETYQPELPNEPMPQDDAPKAE